MEKTKYDKKQNLIFLVFAIVADLVITALALNLIKESNKTKTIEDKLQLITNDYDDIKKLVDKDKAVILYEQGNDDDIRCQNIVIEHDFLEFTQIYIRVHVDEGTVSGTFATKGIYDNGYIMVGMVGSDRCYAPEVLYSINIHGNTPECASSVEPGTFELNIIGACEFWYNYEDDELIYVDYSDGNDFYFHSVIGIY